MRVGILDPGEKVLGKGAAPTPQHERVEFDHQGGAEPRDGRCRASQGGQFATFDIEFEEVEPVEIGKFVVECDDGDRVSADLLVEEAPTAAVAIDVERPFTRLGANGVDELESGSRWVGARWELG